MKWEKGKAAPPAKSKQFKSNFTFHISLKSNLIELVELFVGRFAESHDSSSPLSAPNQFCSTAPQEQGRQNWITAGGLLYCFQQNNSRILLFQQMPQPANGTATTNQTFLIWLLDCSLGPAAPIPQSGKSRLGGSNEINQLFQLLKNKVFQ